MCVFYLFSECGRASSIRRVDGDKSIEKRRTVRIRVIMARPCSVAVWGSSEVPRLRGWGRTPVNEDDRHRCFHLDTTGVRSFLAGAVAPLCVAGGWETMGHLSQTRPMGLPYMPISWGALGGQWGGIYSSPIECNWTAPDLDLIRHQAPQKGMTRR